MPLCLQYVDNDNIALLPLLSNKRQINICALGPLRVNNACVNEGVLADGAKLAIITSQAGSTEWRSTQNKEEGGDYGHHMSRAAW